jgi:hypothetical protein
MWTKLWMDEVVDGTFPEEVVDGTLPEEVVDVDVDVDEVVEGAARQRRGQLRRPASGPHNSTPSQAGRHKGTVTSMLHSRLAARPQASRLLAHDHVPVAVVLWHCAVCDVRSGNLKESPSHRPPRSKGIRCSPVIARGAADGVRVLLGKPRANMLDSGSSKLLAGCKIGEKLVRPSLSRAPALGRFDTAVAGGGG